MPSFAQIFFEKDGSALDIQIAHAQSLSHVLWFLDHTAAYRSADVVKVLWSSNGEMIYDRMAGAVRKTAVWHIPPTEIISGFVSPALDGASVRTIAAFTIFDPFRECSMQGLRYISIPGPVDEIALYEEDIVEQFRLMMGASYLECHGLRVFTTRIGVS